MSEEFELDPDKEIKNPRFYDNDGVAICANFTKYGANGMGASSLMMKANDDVTTTELRKALKQVRVELSMEEFLRKFFDMWGDNAKILAKILGYEVEDATETYDDYIENKVESVELLKSLKTEEDFFKLDPATQDKFISLQVKFENGLSSGAFSGGSKEEDTSSNLIKNSENGEDNEMSEDMKKTLEDMQKSLEDMKGALKAEKDARAAAEAKVVEQEKDAILSKTADITYIDEDAVTLLKSLDTDVLVGIVDILQKSKQAQDELTEKLEKASEEGDILETCLSKSNKNAKDEDGDEEEEDLVKSALTRMHEKSQ